MLMAPALESCYSPDFQVGLWPQAPFIFYNLKLSGFRESLDEIVNADWRIGGHASPLDLDERIREPTIDYDPQLVVCTVSGMTAAMKSGQRDTLPPHCWTPDHEYGS